MTKWTKCSEVTPDPLTEVLVWVDGHRGPLWHNNHHLIAYLDWSGNWREERHPSQEPLIGVIAWTALSVPWGIELCRGEI